MPGETNPVRHDPRRGTTSQPSRSGIALVGIGLVVLLACQPQRPETSLEPSIMYRKPCASAQQLVVTNRSGEPIRVYGLPEGDPGMGIQNRGGITELATLFSPVVDTLEPPGTVFSWIFALPLDQPYDARGRPRTIRGVNVRCVPRDTGAAARPAVIENPPASSPAKPPAAR